MLKAYKLLKNNNIIIANADEFQETTLCKTYDKYGQEVGCYDAGCYCLDNDASPIFEDLIEKFSLPEGIWDSYPSDIDELETHLQEQKIDPEKIETVINWVKQNEFHDECVSWDYFNGHNWQSLILESNIQEAIDLEEIEPKLEEKIIKAFNQIDTYIETGTHKRVDQDGFTFLLSISSTFPYLAELPADENKF